VDLIRVDTLATRPVFPGWGTYRLFQASRTNSYRTPFAISRCFTDGAVSEGRRAPKSARQIGCRTVDRACAPGLNRLIEKFRADLVDGIYVHETCRPKVDHLPLVAEPLVVRSEAFSTMVRKNETVGLSWKPPPI